MKSVNITGNIKTPQYFDGDITVKAEAVTLEVQDRQNQK